MKKHIIVSYLIALTLSTTAFGQDQIEISGVIKPTKPTPELLEEVRQHPDKVNKQLCQQLITCWSGKEDKAATKIALKQTIELSDSAEDLAFMYQALRPAFIAQLYPELAQNINDIKSVTKVYKNEGENHYVYQKYIFVPMQWDTTEAIEKFKKLSPMEQKTILSLWVEGEESFGQPVDFSIDEDTFFDDFFNIF